MIVIADTTPLLYLSRIGRLEIVRAAAIALVDQALEIRRRCLA
ncbi:hypothetical protein WME75_01770 [Sorangium sp. So ce1014]